MTAIPLPWVLGLLLGAAVCVMAGPEQYPLGPESQPQDVPHGTITHCTWTSHIFPGTLRDYWVYVPAQYTPDKPACVMVFQDGAGYVDVKGRWRIPVVFDNMIHAGDIPVTIGIFVNPGTLPPPVTGLPGRPNRSFEYDSISDRYARFLLEEILPEVGRHYNLSHDPNDRAICGASSGGICSFTAAWFRPDAFRRVLSFVGSFSNLRGGDTYPSLIRKTETKPIRVFIQSGKRDMNTYAGSWYIQNQAMAAAFEYMGYDYKVVLGEEGHNSLHGSSILPDALRWLWRDWPQPITAPRPPDTREWATNIVEPDTTWEVCEGLSDVRCVAADAKGAVYVAADGSKSLLRPDTVGKAEAFATLDAPATDLACGVDGRVYAADGDGVTLISADGTKTALANAAAAASVVPGKAGVYLASPEDRRVQIVDAAGTRRVACEDVTSPSGLQLMPGGSLMAIADAHERWVWSVRVEADGTLSNGEPFYRLETTDKASATEAAGMAADDKGFLYVATNLGIQVCDPEGRTAFIIANPPAGTASSIAFGGPGRQTLFAVAGGKLYRRATLRKGAVP